MGKLRRKIVFPVAMAAIVILAGLAYTPAKQFHRFFLTACAADGPSRETELDIDPQPVDLAQYYVDLRKAGEGLEVREIAHAEYQGERWPILLFGPPARESASLLVVAGIHGNEVSGSLAAIEILRSLRGSANEVAMHVLAPANPVGLKYGSRYNSTGCDINRDFKTYQTAEAQAIRQAIAEVKPALVVSLHEGPQAGAFVIGTQTTAPGLLDAITAAMKAQRFPLATENNLGMSLEVPGTMIEGAFMTRAKGWLGIYSLGEHATSVGIPLITTEAPWQLPSMEDRIAMQRLTVQVLLEQLSRAN